MDRFRGLRIGCLVVLGAFEGCNTGSAPMPLDPTPVAAASPDPRDAGASPSAPDDDASAAEQGAVLVAERGCARCHQSPNPDDGILSGQTTPRPGTHAYGANLTPDMETGIGGWSDPMILRAIRTGVDDQARALCVMPHFADLSPDEGARIVSYLRSLEPVHREIPESACDDGADAEPDAGEDAPGDASGEASSDAAPEAGCGTYVGPTVAAPCHGCGTHACQANGCWGGWFCETVSKACHPAPPGCAAR